MEKKVTEVSIDSVLLSLRWMTKGIRIEVMKMFNDGKYIYLIEDNGFIIGYHVWFHSGLDEGYILQGDLEGWKRFKKNGYKTEEDLSILN